jgi:hypothetical protein
VPDWSCLGDKIMEIIIYPKISESCKKSSMRGDIIASCIIAKFTENLAFNFPVGRIDDCALVIG